MSANERAAVFGDDDLDLTEFAPKPPAKPKEVRAVAEKAGFSSREPAREPVEAPKREQRRHRTGRNMQLSLKVRQDDLDAFYKLADREGVVLGEAFARAVAAWGKSLSES